MSEPSLEPQPATRLSLAAIALFASLTSCIARAPDASPAATDVECTSDACMHPQPPPLLSGVGPLGAMAMSGTKLYVTTRNGALYAVPKDGSPPRLLIERGVEQLFQLSSVGDHLYGAGTNRLVDIALSTGTVTVLADDVSVSSMRADESGIYWASPSDHSFRVFDFATGAVRILNGAVSDVCSMALDSGWVYVAPCGSSGAFLRISKSTYGVTRPIRYTAAIPSGIALTGGHTFFLERNTAEMGWQAADVLMQDDAPPLPIAQRLEPIGDTRPAFAADDTLVVVAGSFPSGPILSARASDTSWRRIATSIDTVRDIVIDAKNVYWLEDWHVQYVPR